LVSICTLGVLRHTETATCRPTNWDSSANSAAWETTGPIYLPGAHFGLSSRLVHASTSAVPRLIRNCERDFWWNLNFCRLITRKWRVLFRYGPFVRPNVNFALVMDMNASSKEHQAQDHSPENKRNNYDSENRFEEVLSLARRHAGRLHSEGLIRYSLLNVKPLEKCG